jgi:hypothetical protein
MMSVPCIVQSSQTRWSPSLIRVDPSPLSCPLRSFSIQGCADSGYVGNANGLTSPRKWSAGETSLEKKNHHFVPKAYLKAFANDDGRLVVYRKERARQPLHLLPDEVAFHKYYYSQPLPGGAQDNNTLEGLFERSEAKWPAFLAKIRERSGVNRSLDYLREFIALQRARVPAARDALEARLAAIVLSQLRTLEKAGQLLPRPPSLRGVNILATIDPHQSIHGMLEVIAGAGEVLDRVGLAALVNKTGEPFITSDNPVCWFDPSQSDEVLKPYVLSVSGPVFLLFPLAPDMLIVGTSIDRERFLREGFGFGATDNPNEVRVINRQICRFAYRAVISNVDGLQPLVQEYASQSPVLRTNVVHTGSQEQLHFDMVFGPVPRKPKWRKK